MYCGDNLGTDIDHYRPKRHWPLLTFDWPNHLLSCSKCNSLNKGDQFPVGPNGEPMLLDPTLDDPAEHLHLVLATGEYLDRTPRGEATIRLLDLNRPDLVQGRDRAVRDTARLLCDWRFAIERADIVHEDLVLYDLRRVPFAMVADAMLRQADDVAVEARLAHDPATLAFLRDPEVRETGIRALLGR